MTSNRSETNGIYMIVYLPLSPNGENVIFFLSVCPFAHASGDTGQIQIVLRVTGHCKVQSNKSFK